MWTRSRAVAAVSSVITALIGAAVAALLGVLVSPLLQKHGYAASILWLAGCWVVLGTVVMVLNDIAARRNRK